MDNSREVSFRELDPISQFEFVGHEGLPSGQMLGQEELGKQSIHAQ